MIIVITIEGSERICEARTVIVILGLSGASAQGAYIKALKAGQEGGRGTGVVVMVVVVLKQNMHIYNSIVSHTMQRV